MHKKIKRPIYFFIIDILISIDNSSRYFKKIKKPWDLVKNSLVCDAIIRNLEIIGEAMNHVLRDEKLQSLIKPDWRDIVDFRNIAIHEYFGINYEEVFDIVETEIPKLESEIFDLIKSLKDDRELLFSIECVCEELLSKSKNQNLLYINKIKKILIL
ncbi:DUF86 domain-containing protein [Candidatus Babeliales bacterium]|nr:DUF86 domain-containing protein [Candidatus Babeliales bacterium]